MIVRTKRHLLQIIEFTNGANQEVSTDFAFDMRDVITLEAYTGNNFQGKKLVEIQIDYDKVLIEEDFNDLFTKFEKSRKTDIIGLYN
jgi:hypothetical protein